MRMTISFRALKLECERAHSSCGCLLDFLGSSASVLRLYFSVRDPFSVALFFRSTSPSNRVLKMSFLLLSWSDFFSSHFVVFRGGARR